MSERGRNRYQDQNTSKNFDLWRQQLGDHLNCKRNDMKCWISLLPKLSCQIDDPHCWKTKLPNIPCEQNDSECWRHLLPHLPCKLEDHNCWKDIKTGYVLRDINNHDERVIELSHRQQGYDPMRSLEKRYGGMVTKENHGWLA